MERVGAGFGGEVVEATASLAELSRIIAGLEREFLHHFHGRRGHGGGPAGVVLAGGILAIHLHAEGAGGETVHVCRVALAKRIIGDAGGQDVE